MKNKEKLEEAKRLYESANADQKYVLESLFPELKESDDERIRKWLVDTIKAVPNDSIEWEIIDKSDIIAWLEKQGEPTDNDMVEALRSEYEKGRYDAITEMVDGWSVEDMSKVQRICKYLDEAKKYYADITEVRECTNWLKSLKDRVQPQPKQEWSEEDVYNSKLILSTISQDQNLSLETKDKLTSWFKSLKPQNHWKPSKGQLECLGYAIDKAKKDYSPLANNRIYLTLKALKEELEKLKGE